MGSGIGVAIIGCGGITSAHLNGIRILQEHGLDNVRVVALCSRDPENTARYNDRANAADPLPEIVPGVNDPLNLRDIYVTDLAPGVPAAVYTDWRDAVVDPAVDAVVVLATVDVHHLIALGAIEAGKHVIMEKPFAITVRAAMRVCEAADDAKLRLAVAESLRYRKAMRAKRWAIDEGAIGEVQMVVYAGIGSVWSPDKIVGKTAWRHQKLATGSGLLMDIGSHLFDGVRYLCGEPAQITGTVRTIEPMRTTRDESGSVVEQVACDVEDTAFASMVLENGAIGSFAMSWAGHGEPCSLPGGMVIYGTMGCITGDRVVSDQWGSENVVEAFDARADRSVKERWFPSGIEDAFALELHDFFATISGGGHRPETDGIEGLRDIAVGYGIIESSVCGEAVAFRDVESCSVETYQRAINDRLDIR